MVFRSVRDALSNTCQGRWIGRGGPTAWPPRSTPGLNPLWGHLNAAPADNEGALHHRTVDACQTVRNYPGIFVRMQRSIVRRVEARTESHGGHFELLL
jgi:hypothetical protein